MNKTAAKKISSQVSMSVKRCLGLHQSLPQKSLYTWLYDLSPIERAEIFLLRTLKKLLDMKHSLKNKDFFLSKIENLSKDLALNYLSGKTKLSEIKSRLVDTKAKEVGILNGKPFETLCTNDLDWLRFSTKELDIFRFKGKTCSHCGIYLSTDNLKICTGTEYDREFIETETGIKASKILEDPSVLNKKPSAETKRLKSLVAERISKMIHSAGRSVIA